MKKIKIFLVILSLNLFSSGLIFSQNSWIRQDSVQGTNRTICILDGNTGFYTGFGQRIHKTTNGGNSWSDIPNSNSDNYKKIFCLNNGLVFALTSFNVLYKSTNFGDNWVSYQISSGGNMSNSVFMCDANTGYLTNYTFSPSSSYILKTTNGGVNWDVVYNYPDGQSCTEIFCLNKDTVFVCGHSDILKTTNGGSIWNITTLAQYQLALLFSIQFINSSTGFAAGSLFHLSGTEYYPLVYKTTNEGANWSEVVLPSSGIYGKYYGMDFKNSNNGFVVGDSGSVFKTTNSGLNWYRLRKFPGIVYDVAFWEEEKASIVLSNGSVYTTTNGGWDYPTTPVQISPANNSSGLGLTPSFTWSIVKYNAVHYLLQISLDSNFSSIFHSVDSYDATITLTPGILTPDNVYYWRVKSLNPIYSSPWSTVWQFNTFSPQAPSLIIPVNRDTVVSSQQIFDWNDVLYANYYKIQVLKDTLNFSVSVDSNVTVSQIKIPSIKFIGNRTYFWRVRAFNNSGAGPWSEIRMFRTAQDCPILYTPLNNDTGIVYNSLFDWSDYPGSTIYRIQFSNDSLFSPIAFDINWLFYSELHIYMPMQPNAYYYWRVNSKFNDSLYTFWSEIRRFRTSPTYTNIINSLEIPAEFRLYDNFPNPFNPRSIIKFDLPQSDQVQIIILNPLGKLITVLLDKKLNAGSYEIVFDGQDLPSGVYFYRIIAGKYSETKKMVLIK
ncbi:MAG: YCF48-related protein [Ignavibacteria bacterium]